MMQISWNISLAVLSVLLVVTGIFAALTQAQRMCDNVVRLALIWMWTCAITLGMAIWAMQLVGLLAWQLPATIAFDPILTTLSVLPALLASSLLFYLLKHDRTGKLHLLQVSEERLRITLKHAPDAVFICKGDGAIDYVNDSVIELLGYDREALYGMTVFDLAPVDWRSTYMQMFEQISGDNERHVFDIRLIKKDGG